MAFLRFSRDKRGYEHFYLVETTTGRRGKSRARVLYWFRTPPSIKVGREPFDPEIRRALESQNPGVAFDWSKIESTPIPSVETERWRERRRAEKERRAGQGPPTAQAGPADEVVGPAGPVGPVGPVGPDEPDEPDDTVESFEAADLDEPFEPGE